MIYNYIYCYIIYYFIFYIYYFIFTYKYILLYIDTILYIYIRLYIYYYIYILLYILITPDLLYDYGLWLMILCFIIIWVSAAIKWNKLVCILTCPKKSKQDVKGLDEALNWNIRWFMIDDFVGQKNMIMYVDPGKVIWYDGPHSSSHIQGVKPSSETRWFWNAILRPMGVEKDSKRCLLLNL